jgi:hypothetical protein
MSFRQTYYTSCQQGLRGGKGFQINAATEGIDPSVLQQIERLGLYVPPISVPSRPSLEEIERFPVSMLFQLLGDGSAVFAQAKYTGADYSGRFGNYFTHSLISAALERDLKEEGLLPIELWGSLMWSTTESPGLTLPPFERLEAGGLIDPDRVAEFLAENERMKHLPAFLTAIEGALSTGRRIIFVEPSQSVALWIAAASYALPRHLALRLTFNTYVKNPYQSDFLLVGTTSDSDFGFAQHEIEHQFYVFDFEGGRFTRITEFTPFAQKAAAAYRAGYPHAIADFSLFVERVAPALGMDELDAAFSFHVKRSGFEPPNMDEALLLGWCARRLNGFDARELQDLIASVAGQAATRDEVLDAYTSLYLAAVNDSTRSDIRKLIELPYLEWLIKVASQSAPLAAFQHAAERLRVQPSAIEEAAPFILLWIRQARQCEESERLSALFMIADKLGFFDKEDDSLRLVGEEMVGHMLAAPLVAEVLKQYVAKPGVRSIVQGVGTFLATKVSSPVAFRPLASVLSCEEIYHALVKYAFEQQAIALYFRLVGARLPSIPVHAKQRLEAFKECIEGIRRLSTGMPGELVENAYDAIWQGTMPSFEEAINLIDELDRLRISGTGIPKRLVELVKTCDVMALDSRQHELISRLSARNPIYQTLGEKQSLIDAYRIPAELELSGDELAREIEESLKFLEGHPELGKDLIARASAVIARYLLQVKDPELHSTILMRAYNRVGGPPFLEAYGQGVIVVLEKPSSSRPKVAARLVRTWSYTEQRKGKFIANTMFDEFLPKAISRWRTRELEEVESGLERDLDALGRWLMSREAAEESRKASGVRGFFGKIFDRNDNDRR